MAGPASGPAIFPHFTSAMAVYPVVYSKQKKNRFIERGTSADEVASLACLD
jgi:hypothetical protein